MVTITEVYSILELIWEVKTGIQSDPDVLLSQTIFLCCELAHTIGNAPSAEKDKTRPSYTILQCCTIPGGQMKCTDLLKPFNNVVTHVRMSPRDFLVGLQRRVCRPRIDEVGAGERGRGDHRRIARTDTANTSIILDAEIRSQDNGTRKSHIRHLMRREPAAASYARRR